jgi:hypothetical protein
MGFIGTTEVVPFHKAGIASDIRENAGASMIFIFRNYRRPKARPSSGFFLKKKTLCTLLEKSTSIPKIP